MNLSVIIPVRNEQDIIVACLNRVTRTYPDAEILVVDGGWDETAQRIRSMKFLSDRVRYLRNTDDRGKGHAIRVGAEAASGDIVAQLDADLQFLPEQLPLLVEPIVRGEADLTLGSRFHRESLRREGSSPWHRTVGNRAISAYASWLCGQRLTDVLAGFKAWRRDVLVSSPLTSDGYSYEVEIVVKALRNGWRVLDVPVETTRRATGTSSVSVLPVGVKLIFDSLRFRLT